MRVLGVDGGQSGIRLRHSAEDRVTEVEGVSRGEGDVVAAVADAVAQGWRRGGYGAVDRVVLGLTTAPSDPDEADRLATMVAAATGAPEVWVADDAVTSHAGALSMGPGVSVVAGTGVACLALPREREPRIIGGHGFLLGDEGGGFWIGSRGLNAVLRAADGRGEPTALTGGGDRSLRIPRGPPRQAPRCRPARGRHRPLRTRRPRGIRLPATRWPAASPTTPRRSSCC